MTPYERGQAAFSEGHYAQAKQHAGEGLRQEPEDASLNLLMAQALVAQENYRAAESYAIKAFEDGEEPAEAGRVLGKIHWELGRPIEAVEAWRAARDEAPESVGDSDYQRALEAAISTAMTLQQFDTALDLREQLAEIDPAHPEVAKQAFRANREQLAQAHVRSGEYEEAVEIYRRLIEAFPERGAYALSMGRHLIRLDRGEEAIESFTAYVDGAASDSRITRILEVARRAESMNAQQVAVHFYQVALDEMAGQASFRRAKLNLTLAGIYFAQQQVQRGVEHIERYLSDMTQLRGLPLNAEVYITAADTASEHNQHDYALELLENGLENAPPSWHVAAKLASLYARRARTGEMERVLTAYVERSGDTSSAKLQVARWALDRRNYDLAQHFFERAVEHDEAEPGTWLELARVYSTLGQLDRLKHTLDTYVKKFEHGRYELLDVAVMYQKHRLYEQAEDVLLEAQKDDPKSLVVVDRLAQLYTDWGKPSKLHSYYEAWVKARGAKAEDYQLVGERFVRQGRPNEALPYLEKAAKKGSAQSWLQMADVYSRQRRDIDMKRALEQYMQAAPRTASTLRSVLSRYRSSGMHSEAVGVLEQLLEIEPGVLSHYQQLSRFYFEQGRENDAVVLWTRYLEQSDRPIETLETIAQWFQRRGQPQWILTIYRRLLKQGDADPRIYRLVGDTYLMIDQRQRQIGSRAQSVSLSDPQKQAERFYEIYLDKASPKRPDLVDFADSMRRQEMWDIAARIYARLVQDEAKGSKLWFNYARVLLNVGKVGEAETLLARYYEARGDNVEDARVIADALFDAGRYTAVEPYLNKMFSSEQPTYVHGSFRRLADLYQATERHDEITTLTKQFLERAQNPTKARQEILAVLQNMGMFAEAAEQIEHIRTFQGDVMDFQLAENLFRAGRTDKAEASFAKYADENAYPGDAWVTVGDFYTGHGAGDLAKRAYNKSVDAAPDNAKTHTALGRFLILQGDVKAGREALALARKKMAPVQREEITRLEIETLAQVMRNGEARDLATEALKTASRHKEYFQLFVFDYDLATQEPTKVQRTLQDLSKSSLGLRDKIDMLARNGFREEAAKLLEDEIANGDRYAAARVVRDRSDVLTTLGGFDRLEKAVKPLLEQPNEGSRQQAQIGEYFISQGEYQRGIPYLRSAIAQGHVEFRQSLAHAYAALGYHKEALRVHQRLLEGVGESRVAATLRAIGVQYEVHGQPKQFLKLLRVLTNDRRYAAKAAPLLAKLLAEQGRIEEASSVIFDAMSRPQQKDEDAESVDVVIDWHRDADVETLAGALEALAGEGYVDEARGLLGELSADLRADDRLQTLALKLAISRSEESAEEHATSAVADFELSHDDNKRRLQVAELLRNHGMYPLADKLAARGLENPDYAVNRDTTLFLISNAFAANDTERLDTLAKNFVEASQDKVAAKSHIAEYFRRLGLDERALETAVSVARATPVRKHTVDALTIAQAAGDREQMAEMTDQYMRVGRDPMNLLYSLLTRWSGQQDPSLTRPLLERYQSVHPAVFEPRMLDIELTFREGDVDRARAKLDELLTFVDFDPYAVHRIVVRLNRAGLYVETARVVAPKLEGRAINAQTQLMIGVALQKLGLAEEADERFERYIEVSSDGALAATEIAKELLAHEQLDKAATFANLAVQKSPERPEPYFYRGLTRLHSGEVDAARRDLDRSIGSGVDRIYGLYNAGYHALKAGENAVATAYITELATTASPQEPEVPLRLAVQCFVQAEQAQAGISFFEEHFPTVAAGTGVLGEAVVPSASGLYEAAGHHERAFGLYDSAIAERLVRDPGNASVAVYFNNLAYTFSTTNKQLDRGFDLVRRAIAVAHGRNPSYLDTLGWLHFRRGELDEAETLVRSSLRTASGSQSEMTELFEHLIEIKRAKGQLDDAVWLDVYLENMR